MLATALRVHWFARILAGRQQGQFLGVKLQRGAGMEVLLISFGFLFLIWAAILWGSRFFGSPP